MQKAASVQYGVLDDATVTSYTRTELALDGALGKERNKLWNSSVKVPKGVVKDLVCKVFYRKSNVKIWKQAIANYT